MKSLFGLFRRGANSRESSLAAAAECVRNGTAAEDRGDFSAARDSYRRAVELAPDDAEAHFNLGNACSALDRQAEALRSYRQAVALQPGHLLAHLNLGATLLRANDPAAAETTYRKALELRPDSGNAWVGLGCALEMKADMNGARAAFERAVSLDPAHEGAISRLAQVLRADGEAKAALAVLAAGLRHAPDNRLLLRTQADIDAGIGEYARAIAAYRRIVALSARFDSASSNLLWTLNFVPGMSATEILAEHKAVAARLEQECERLPARRPERLQRRLRIGYVSPDFCRHSVSCFIEPVLRNHDRARVEIHCFHDHRDWDDVTERINKSAERWHEIADLSDESVAQRIVENEIDILVDLAGHTAHNRMRVFAAKPAPLQVSWLGYLSTTGLSTIDYRLCDRHTDPEPLAEAWQVEKPLRLPGSQWCYQPQVPVPEPSPLPRSMRGYWTFGSFNQESKLNSATLDAWAAVLAAIPDSRLRVIGVSCDVVAERIAGCMAQRSVAQERLELVGRVPIDAYFAAYGSVDIALDTFPYNGATTTCDALAMGVPVATVAGHRSIERGGVSLLTTVGLQEWIAGSAQELSAVLRELTRDPERIAALRRELRPRLQASPLMDGGRFAGNLESAFYDIWEGACLSSGTAPSGSTSANARGSFR